MVDKLPQPQVMTNPPSITCPSCGRVSYRPKDIEHRYCAVCGFHDDDREPGCTADLCVCALHTEVRGPALHSPKLAELLAPHPAGCVRWRNRPPPADQPSQAE